MENLSFDIAGNSQVFIQQIEQIRIAIHAVTEESERASNASNGFAKVLSKTVEAVAGQEALQKFVSDVIRVRGEYQQLEVSFATSGISMLQELSNVMGVSKEKVNEMVAAGEVGFPEVQRAIVQITYWLLQRKDIII